MTIRLLFLTIYTISILFFLWMMDFDPTFTFTDPHFLGLIFLLAIGIAGIVYTIRNHMMISIDENTIEIKYLLRPLEKYSLLKLESWYELRYYLRSTLQQSLILFFDKKQKLTVTSIDSPVQFEKLLKVLHSHFDHLDHTRARRVIIKRTFKFLPEQIYNVWTDLKKLALWWCPEGTLVTHEEFKLQTQGNWRFQFHGIGGRRNVNILFLKVVPKKLITWVDQSDDSVRYLFWLEQEKEFTHAYYEVVFPSIELCEKLGETKRREIKLTFDRLERILGLCI